MSSPTSPGSSQPDGQQEPDDHRTTGSHHDGHGLQPRPQTPGPVPVTARRERPPGKISARRPDQDASGGGQEISDLVAAGVLDAVPGEPPVPVSVWAATGPGERPVSPGSILAGLTTRLARMLLTIWSDPGETVIDTTTDLTVEDVAASSARTYVPLRLPPSARQLRTLGGQAALILLRWPPVLSPGRRTQAGRANPMPDQRADAATGPGADRLSRGMLTICRELLAPEGHVVVILAPPTGRPYRDHARDIIPAARHAGLGYLQHLVIVTTQVPAVAPDTDWLAHPRAHIDLLVFIVHR